MLWQLPLLHALEVVGSSTSARHVAIDAKFKFHNSFPLFRLAGFDTNIPFINLFRILRSTGRRLCNALGIHPYRPSLLHLPPTLPTPPLVLLHSEALYTVETYIHNYIHTVSPYTTTVTYLSCTFCLTLPKVIRSNTSL